MTNWTDPRIFGPWQEPAFVLVFGAQGAGKTFDSTLFAVDGITLALPGALKGVREVVGDSLYEVAKSRTIPVQHLHDVLGVLNAIRAGQIPKLPVRIDDLSVVASRTLDILREHYPANKTFQLYGAFRGLFTQVRDAARHAGVHVIGNAHARSPSTSEKGEFRYGGPDLGAPSVTGVVTAVADVVYGLERTDRPRLFPNAYRCDYPSSQWCYKDRHSVIQGTGPANLAEIFRKADMVVPRPAGFEWMDTAVEKIAARLEAGEDLQEVGGRLKSALASQPPGLVYWILRDASDRVELRAQPSVLDVALRRLDAPPPTVTGLGAPAPSGGLGLGVGTPADTAVAAGDAPPPSSASIFTSTRS